MRSPFALLLRSRNVDNTLALSFKMRSDTISEKTRCRRDLLWDLP